MAGILAKLLRRVKVNNQDITEVVDTGLAVSKIVQESSPGSLFARGVKQREKSSAMRLERRASAAVSPTGQ